MEMFPNRLKDRMRNGALSFVIDCKPSVAEPQRAPSRLCQDALGPWSEDHRMQCDEHTLSSHLVLQGRDPSSMRQTIYSPVPTLHIVFRH